MTGAQGPAAAGGDQLRVGDADRERVIETLKDAFADGRLTRDELGTRVGEALSARTRADLAALTADIPAVSVPAVSVPAVSAPVVSSAPAAAGLARPPAPARRRPLARAAAWSGGFLVLAAVAVWLAFLAGPGGASPDPYSSLAPGFLFLAYVAVVAALGCAGYGVFASAEQRRSRRALPPRPGPGGHARPGERRDGAGRDPVPPGSRAVQARAGVRAGKTREHRRHLPGRAGRVPGGAGLVPGAT